MPDNNPGVLQATGAAPVLSAVDNSMTVGTLNTTTAEVLEPDLTGAAAAATTQQPFYKKSWFIVLMVALGVGIVGGSIYLLAKKK